VAPAQPRAEAPEVDVGLNTRSYSGINAAVRLGVLDRCRAVLEGLRQLNGTANGRWAHSRRCPGNRTRPPRKREGPLLYTTFSCCCPRLLLLLIQRQNAYRVIDRAAPAHRHNALLLLISSPWKQIAV
jgi:hypothetical protein